MLQTHTQKKKKHNEGQVLRAKTEASITVNISRGSITDMLKKIPTHKIPILQKQ